MWRPSQQPSGSSSARTFFRRAARAKGILRRKYCSVSAPCLGSVVVLLLSAMPTSTGTAGKLQHKDEEGTKMDAKTTLDDAFTTFPDEVYLAQDGRRARLATTPFEMPTPNWAMPAKSK
ncbi:hypothetical protein WJ05_15120 [Burkholderia vietnamiensis]|nr:hypothetical protein WJ05_15120 [Burkholderia vietnamiensis]